MQQLILEAGAAASRKELEFHILNRTVEVMPFDRAVLWDLQGRPSLLGVSGVGMVDKHSALARHWRELVDGIADKSSAAIFTDAGRADAAPPAPDAPPPADNCLWLPIKSEGRLVAGLLLERWGRTPWAEADVKISSPLASGYGSAWRPFLPRRGLGHFVRRRAPLVAAAAAAVLIPALLFVRAPLRIVAPCEVVPNNPYLINAPMDGVIEEILVHPGQEVLPGDEVFVYAGETVAAEYDIARQQTNMARSDLERARAQALSNRQARAQVKILESRLRQEEVRLEAAEYRMSRLRVAAGKAGVALLGEPSEWRGRPVSTGEGVMLLVDPTDSKVRIWLPQDDRIDFDADSPVSILLNADSGRTRRADLKYVAAHAQSGPEGVYGFMAEADWRDHDAVVNIGLKGTAIIYGERVSLAYWLFRKPLAAARRFLGI